MANPFHHAVSSARLYGGEPEDYLAIHQWFDESKAHVADFRHRALRHHTEGIYECERTFGVTVENASGRPIPTRWIGEQHVREDLGFIPTLADWLLAIKPKRWMFRSKRIAAEKE